MIGLDGAGWPLVRPWLEDGTMPALARLVARGAHGTLRSTLPPATFPAWTSLVTGVNPGRHGVLDFSERVPGTLRLRFVNGSWRRTPAFWSHLSASGRSVAVLSVPATYPPEPVRGTMVSGFDTPLTAAIDGTFVHPRARWPEIRALVGRLPFADFQEVATGPGWHARALASLVGGIARRERLALHVLAADRPDALMIVFGESDTVAHHFWRFHDAASPRFAPSPHADAVRQVYARLDAAIGRLVATAGADATVAVVSDHGSGGAGTRAVYLNRRLAECGLLRFAAGGGGGVARRVRALATRSVPFRLQAPLLRRLPGVAGRLEAASRTGGLDWSRTAAYSEELDYHPCVWLNLRGREPAGTVAAAEYGAVRERVLASLSEWRDDAGLPVVERVWRREEVYHGPCLERAPDLLLELAHERGYSPSTLRSHGPGPSLGRIAAADFGAGKSAGMNGAHRRDGIVVLAGAGVRPAGDVGVCPVVDVMPTLLALCGVPFPVDLDGRPIAEALASAAETSGEASPSREGSPCELDEESRRDMAARLAALGYLEPAG